MSNPLEKMSTYNNIYNNNYNNNYNIIKNKKINFLILQDIHRLI